MPVFFEQVEMLHTGGQLYPGRMMAVSNDIRSAYDQVKYRELADNAVVV